MVDRQFSDPDLAALYDALNSAGGRADVDFYLPLVMSARAVLDVGCVGWDCEFDLVVMTGHAFQVLLTDDEIRSALAEIRRAAAEPEHAPIPHRSAARCVPDRGRPGG